jgi:hypothetical protein
MIKLYIVGIALAIPFFLKGQQYDNNWVINTNYIDSNIIINFNNDLTINKVKNNIHYWRANTSISDSAGNLLWYSNGSKIMNRNAQIMQGGDSINYDYGTYDWYGSYHTFGSLCCLWLYRITLSWTSLIIGLWCIIFIHTLGNGSTSLPYQKYKYLRNRHERQWGL